MGRGSVRVQVSELNELVATLKMLGNDGAKRKRELDKQLRGAAKPYVPKIKTAINKIPSKGLQPSQAALNNRKGKTLRRLFQDSVTIQVRSSSGKFAGVTIFMNPKKMPTGMKSLPAYFEQAPGYAHLRHPRFGNRELWHQQDVYQPGYFTREIEGLEDDAVEAIMKIVDNVRRELES